MPEICRFYGIIIRIHTRDHGPPHFHALYSGQQVLVEISTLAILDGRLPVRARRLVLEWAALHQAELMDAWNRARAGQPAGRIPPLE